MLLIGDRAMSWQALDRNKAFHPQIFSIFLLFGYHHLCFYRDIAISYKHIQKKYISLRNGGKYV